MSLDGGAIVGANIDVDRHDYALAANELEHGCVQHRAATASHSRLDDKIGLHAPDELLHRDDVLREREDRLAEPVEVVGVAVSSSCPYERVRQAADLAVGLLRCGILLPLLGELRRVVRRVGLCHSSKAYESCGVNGKR